MPLTSTALRQLSAIRSDYKSLDAERLDAFVREQKELVRRNAFPAPSSPVRPVLPPPQWEPDETESVRIAYRFREQPAEDDRTVAQKRRFQRAKEILRPEFSAAARKRRAPSTDSSVLQQALISSDHAIPLDEGEESVEEPEKVDRRRTMGFQKRARYKMLKPGATEPERPSTAVPVERKKKVEPKKKEKEKAAGRKRKSISNALIDGFSPDNIAKRRITLKPKSTTVRRDSTPPVRPGLPDLSFAEMSFLRNRKPRPAFEIDVQDPGECRGRLRECMDEIITREEQRRRREPRRGYQTKQERSVSYRQTTAQERSLSRTFVPQEHNVSRRLPSAPERSLSRSFRLGGEDLDEDDDGRSEYSRLGYQSRFLQQEREVSPQRDFRRALTPPDEASEPVEAAQQPERQEEKRPHETADATRSPSQETNVHESPLPEKSEQRLPEPKASPEIPRPPPAQRSSSPLNAILRLCETRDYLPAHCAENKQPEIVDKETSQEDVAPKPTPQLQRITNRAATVNDEDDDPVARINELLDWPSAAQPQAVAPIARRAQHAENRFTPQNMEAAWADGGYHMNCMQAAEQDPGYDPQYAEADPQPSYHPYYDDSYAQEDDEDRLLYEQEGSYYEEAEMEAPVVHYPRTATLSETFYETRSERPQLLIERRDRGTLSIGRDDWNGYGIGARVGKGRLMRGEDVTVEAGLEADMGRFWRPHRL